MGKLILLTGDEFTVKNKARELIVSLCGEDIEGNSCLEIIHGDSDEKKIPELISDLELSLLTPPFLSGQKIIWLKNLDFEMLTKSKGGEAIQEAAAKLNEIVKAPLHDDTSLIISGFSLDGRSSLYKAFQKNAEVHSFAKMDASDRKWGDAACRIIYDICLEKGLKISADASAFIAEISGPDTGRLQSEIDKVSAYIFPEKSITLSACKAICSRTPEAAGWAFSGALLKKNLDEALSALDTLINTQNAEIGILYQAIKEFQDMIKVKAAAVVLGIKHGCSYGVFQSKMDNPPPEIKQRLESSGVLSLHPYRAFMFFSQSENFPDSRISQIITELLKTNRALVSGAMFPKMELENLAIKICAENN